MITRLSSILLATCLTITSAGIDALAEEADPGKKDKLAEITKQQKKEFLELRFGMFIHFGMATYHDVEWASGKEPASSFDPKTVDCEGWLEAAKSAEMQYAVMTTQHVGGFSLWDTKATDYDVASSPYGKDVVRQFVKTFRDEGGMPIGLYISVWDGHHNILTGHITREKIEHVKTQIRELLTNYGKVNVLWLDGYQHEKRGRPAFPNTTEVPFEELYQLAKSIQPECLVVRHPGLSIYDTEFSDVQIWEGIFNHEPTRNIWERFQREHPDNVQEICDTLQHAWFWKTGLDTRPLKPLSYVIEKLKLSLAHNSNYLLNVAINREGGLDQIVIDRLKEVGEVVRKQNLLEKPREHFEREYAKKKQAETQPAQSEQ